MTEHDRLAARLARYHRVDDNGCWLWTGGVTRGGYGKITVARVSGDWSQGQRTALAHRVAYELHVGPIPEGLTIDHLCRTRACINPEHLEPVTMRENTMRGNTVTRANAEKTECIHGHPYDEENTYRYVFNDRECRNCRTCRRETDRRQYLKKRVARPAGVEEPA